MTRNIYIYIYIFSMCCMQRFDKLHVCNIFSELHLLVVKKKFADAVCLYASTPPSLHAW